MTAALTEIVAPLALTYVQGRQNADLSGTAFGVTCPVTAIGTGNLVCVTYGWPSLNNTSASSITVTDNSGQGNTYSKLVRNTSQVWGVAYCLNVRGNPTSITVSKTLQDQMTVTVDEYASGPWMAAAVNDAINMGGSLTISSGNVTTTALNCMLWGAGVNTSKGGLTTTSGWTARQNWSNAVYTEDLWFPNPGTAAATFTAPVSTNLHAYVLAFQPALRSGSARMDGVGAAGFAGRIPVDVAAQMDGIAAASFPVVGVAQAVAQMDGVAATAFAGSQNSLAAAQMDGAAAVSVAGRSLYLTRARMDGVARVRFRSVGGLTGIDLPRSVALEGQIPAPHILAQRPQAGIMAARPRVGIQGNWGSDQ